MATDAADGVTAIRRRVGVTMGVTVRVVDADRLLYCAPMVVDPGAIARAKPLGEIVATVVLELLQVVVLVTSCVVPSV